MTHISICNAELQTNVANLKFINLENGVYNKPKIQRYCERKIPKDVINLKDNELVKLYKF